MSSTAAAGSSKPPSGSASAIVADVASGYHILKVTGYSRTKGTPTGELIQSRPFTVGGHRWRIQYYPNGQTSEATTLATILALAEQHHCQGLKKACFGFLSSPVNLADVLASDGFEYLNTSCPSVVKELVAKLGT